MFVIKSGIAKHPLVVKPSAYLYNDDHSLLTRQLNSGAIRYLVFVHFCYYKIMCRLVMTSYHLTLFSIEKNIKHTKW